MGFGVLNARYLEGIGFWERGTASPPAATTTRLMEPFGASGSVVRNCKRLKEMVGAVGFEPTTSTV
jgi:hypothetical protein